jgi:EmrB/QacA subfamily drug resistance transporter
MALLDVSIVNVALPSIERGLDASAGTVQWAISGYALTLGLVLVPAGRLGDSFGRRRMFLIALSAFVVTSALTGMAPSMGLLIAARLLQGAAAGMLIPQNSGLIQELFDGPERGRAFGILGATVGLATAVVPVAGGLILTAVPGPEDWRWVFYINVPIGLVTVLLARRFLPSAAGDRPRRIRLDVVGALLLGAGILCVLLPLVETGTGSVGGLTWLYGLAVLLLAGFVGYEARTARRGRQPLLDPRLFRISGYAPGAAIGLVYFVGFTGTWLVLAMFFQHGLGYSPLRSGMAVTPFAIGMAASAVIAGRLVTRYGRWVTVCGLTGTVVGLAATALLLDSTTGDAAAWTIALPLLVAGAGGGMVTSPNMTLTLEHVPVAMAGAAGGALQTAQRVGAASGTAVLTTIFYHLLGCAGAGYSAAVRDTLFSAAGFMLLALLLTVADLAAHRRRQQRAAGRRRLADPAAAANEARPVASRVGAAARPPDPGRRSRGARPRGRRFGPPSQQDAGR